MSKNFGYYKKQINDNKSHIDDHNEMFNSIFDKIYPVGSLYWSSKSTNPATLFGIGTWTQIKDKFIYAAGSKSVNATGGAETHTLTTAETPAHTHSRGTMNITGYTDWGCNGFLSAFSTQSTGHYCNNGALSVSTAGDALGMIGTSGSDLYSANVRVNFDASKNWSGATSSVGGSGAHNNMPPYIVKYCWERTA
jgi:microcystin-dependent protein